MSAAPAGPGGPYWSSAVGLGSADGGSGGVQLAASSDGMRLTALWSVMESNSPSVSSASSMDGGATWGSPVALTREDGTWGPRLTSSDDGIRLTAVWTEDYGRDVGYDPASESRILNWYSNLRTASSSDGGRTWSEVGTLAAWEERDEGGAVGFSPAVASSADGLQVVVAWSLAVAANTSVVEAVASNDGGLTWGTKTALSTAGPDATPEVTVSADGVRSVVVWEGQSALGPDIPRETFIDSARSTDRGASWSQPLRVNNTGADFRLHLASSSDGAHLVVAWKPDSDPGDPGFRLASSGDGGNTWNPAVRFAQAPDGGYNNNLQVTSSADGSRVTAIWVHSSPDDYVNPEIQTASSADAGASWGTPTSVSPSNGRASNPEIVGSSDGTVLAAVWVQTLLAYTYDFGVVQAARSTDSGATWEVPVTLSTAEPNASTLGDPQIVSAVDGQRLAANWLRGGADPNLEAAAWPKQDPAVTAIALTNYLTRKFILTLAPRSERPASCSKAVPFRIQKAKYVAVPHGSDEPAFTVVWHNVKGKHYTSTTGWPKTKAVRLGKGTYRGLVSARCGYPAAVSNTATLQW